MFRYVARSVTALALAVVLLSSFSPPAPAAEGDSIDLNRATAEELTRLPGVGEVIAKRIVEFREKHGPFERVEDLMKVKGIGEKSLEKIRPHVRVGKSE